jgi:hypothetical protein
MRFPLLVPLVAVCLISGSVVAGTVLEDHFTAASHPQRKAPANRGEWKFADGVASCIQDDVTFAKNKNHGPVLWYDTAFTDGTVRFAFRTEKVRDFVFTLNSDGHHAFRFVQSPQGLSVRAWTGEGAEAKAESLLPKDAKAPGLTDGQWVEVAAEFSGDRCTLSIGPSFQHTFQHPAIAKKKTTLGLGFSFGTLSVRALKIVTP